MVDARAPTIASNQRKIVRMNVSALSKGRVKSVDHATARQHFLLESAPRVSTVTQAFRAKFPMRPAPAGVQAPDHQVATAPTPVLSTMIQCAGQTAKPTAMSALWTWRTAGTNIYKSTSHIPENAFPNAVNVPSTVP